MPKHTPGPWRVEYIHILGDKEIMGIYAKDGTRIVETDCGVYPPKLADAVLIAAAPKMLEAMRFAILRLESAEDADFHNSEYVSDAIEILVQAIDKATKENV